MYEKPFGTSPAAFRVLDRVVHSVLDEQQVYRIDHFLGKEATQDLHVLRFANGLFAAMWDREHVESVQIDVPEKLGITDRAGFYDATGAVLDMLVTHLFQVAAEVAMEPPASLDAAGAAGGPGEGDQLLPAAGPGGGGARPVRRLPGRARGRGRGPAGTPSSRPGCGSTTPAGAACRSTCEPASGWPPTEQRVSLILREPPGPLAGQLPREGNVLSFSLAGDGEIDLSLVAKKPGPALDVDAAHASIPLSGLRRRATRCRRTSG